MFRNIILAAALVLGISSVTPAVSIVNKVNMGTSAGDTLYLYASGSDTTDWFPLIETIGYGSWGLGGTKPSVMGDSIIVTYQCIGPVQATTDDSTNFTITLQTSEDKTVLSATSIVDTQMRASGGGSAKALLGFTLQPADFSDTVPVAQYARFIYTAGVTTGSGSGASVNDTAYITDIRVRHLSTQFAQ